MYAEELPLQAACSRVPSFAGFFHPELSSRPVEIRAEGPELFSSSEIIAAKTRRPDGSDGCLIHIQRWR